MVEPDFRKGARPATGDQLPLRQRSPLPVIEKAATGKPKTRASGARRKSCRSAGPSTLQTGARCFTGVDRFSAPGRSRFAWITLLNIGGSDRAAIDKIERIAALWSTTASLTLL